MKGLLVRVCIDSTCGPWNGPIDLSTGKFVYVPIPESKPLHSRLSRSFDEVSSSLRALGTSLTVGLAGSPAHVDPDFKFLTYGDQGARAKRIRELLGGEHAGFIVFYGGFRDVNSGTIIDAIIGLTKDVEEKNGVNPHFRRLLELRN